MPFCTRQELPSFANSPVKASSTVAAETSSSVPALTSGSLDLAVLDGVSRTSKRAKMRRPETVATGGRRSSGEEVTLGRWMHDEGEVEQVPEVTMDDMHNSVNCSPAKSPSGAIGSDKVQIGICARAERDKTVVKRPEPKFEADRFDDDICELFASLRQNNNG